MDVTGGEGILQLRKYQEHAVDFCTKSLLTRQGCGLILGMGLGKTIVTLTSLSNLQFVCGEFNKILITAPLRVLKHWIAENEQWGTGFDMHLVRGTPSERNAILKSGAPGIYLVNHELLAWTVKQGFKADCFVIDEGSKFRNWTTQRTKAARKMATYTKYRLLLTATPTPNCLAEIFPQQFIIDRGQSLGNTITKFHQRYMYRGGFQGREWLLIPDLKEDLQNAIAPWYLHQSSVDHLDMPELLENIIPVELPEDAMDIYKQVEKELFAELADNDDLVATNAGAKYNLCRQIASGCAYDEYGVAVGLHDAKMEALEDLLLEIGRNERVVVAYHYRHTLSRLRAKFGKAPVVGGGVKTSIEQILTSWKKGPLLAQAASLSHGVDGLQKLCKTIVWFDLSDSSETVEQLNARIWRQGQESGTVSVHYLLAENTVDAAIKSANLRKSEQQLSLLQRLKQYAQL